jgi:valyl-tRNA synthetase
MIDSFHLEDDIKKQLVENPTNDYLLKFLKKTSDKKDKMVRKHSELYKYFEDKLSKEALETKQSIYKHIEKLELPNIPNYIYRFIDILCNTFIKLSRNRIKEQNDEAISTLFIILKDFNKLLAPFIPHLAEYFNRMLSNNKYQSIHLEIVDINSVFNYQLDKNLLNGFYSVNELLETVRNLRQQINKPIFYPLDKLELYTTSPSIIEYKNIICKELNIKNLIIKSTDILNKIYRPNKGLLCKVFKKEANKYINMIEQGDITWNGCLTDYYTFEYNLDPIENMIGSKFNYNNSNGFISQAVLYLSINTTKENEQEAEINNIRREINLIRKEMNLKLSNKVDIIFEKNSFWENMSCDLIELLSKRLNVEIKFIDNLEEYKIIETFTGNKIKLLIKLI